MLRRATIEAVADRLSLALRHLMEEVESGDSASASQGSSGSCKPSNLHPSLKVRIVSSSVPQLCFLYFSLNVQILPCPALLLVTLRLHIQMGVQVAFFHWFSCPCN